MLYDKGKINGLLLIAPKGVYKNWYEAEIPQTWYQIILKKKIVFGKALINQVSKKKIKYFVSNWYRFSYINYER